LQKLLCEICGSEKNIVVHHLTYEPEIPKIEADNDLVLFLSNDRGLYPKQRFYNEKED